MGFIPVLWATMGNFGEDLRMERLSRGIALEQITAVTKISRRHLEALEQEKFRLLPGGILSKGIVRGYAGAVGLDQQDWTERFLKASGQTVDDDRNWIDFASNVGKARIQRRDALEFRMRWIGAILLLLLVSAAAWLTVRYYGVRAGWWHTVLPAIGAAAARAAYLPFDTRPPHSSAFASPDHAYLAEVSVFAADEGPAVIAASAITLHGWIPNSLPGTRWSYNRSNISRNSQVPDLPATHSAARTAPSARQRRSVTS